MIDKKEYFPKIVKEKNGSGYRIYDKGLVFDCDNNKYVNNPAFKPDSEKYSCYSDDLSSAIQCNVLELCACGDRESNLKYIFVVLKLLNKKSEMSSDIHYFDLSLEERVKFNECIEIVRHKLKQHFKTSESEYFMYYWLDAEGYTQHGSAIPGWLTPKGQELLKLLTWWWNEEGKTAEG